MISFQQYSLWRRRKGHSCIEPIVWCQICGHWC